MGTGATPADQARASGRNVAAALIDFTSALAAQAAGGNLALTLNTSAWRRFLREIPGSLPTQTQPVVMNGPTGKVIICVDPSLDPEDQKPRIQLVSR